MYVYLHLIMNTKKKSFKILRPNVAFFQESLINKTKPHIEELSK